MLIVTILVCTASFAQRSREDQRLLDSLIENDEFLKLLNDMDKPVSDLTIGVAASNMLASVNNNSINALQGNTKITYSPFVSYSHKSGFGISATGYLLTEKDNAGLKRIGITPAYHFTSSKTITAGASYTRFFNKDKYSAVQSPVLNDFYVYALYKKTAIQPGLSFGYSTGKYREIDQVTINLPRQGRLTIIDTAITTLQSFSVTGSAERRFLLHQNYLHKTSLAFTPSLLLNAGSNAFDVVHQNNYAGAVRGRGRKILFRNQSEASGFLLQSAGLNLYAIYSYKQFSFQPQLYLDYYLHHSDESRFTQQYNLTLDYSF